jgi:nucleotide-binding universal stress UspA family protein
MFKNIVVALDGSPSADHAFELASQLAKVEGCALSICSVAHTSVLYGSPQFVERAFADIHAEARRVVYEAIAKANRAGIAVQGCVLEGEPVHEIVTFAKRIKADAIVIGTHARSGLTRLFMGSVAEGVLRRAPMPVLTVRAEAQLVPLAAEAAS